MVEQTLWNLKIEILRLKEQRLNKLKFILWKIWEIAATWDNWENYQILKNNCFKDIYLQIIIRNKYFAQRYNLIIFASLLYWRSPAKRLNRTKKQSSWGSYGQYIELGQKKPSWRRRSRETNQVGPRSSLPVRTNVSFHVPGINYGFSTTLSARCVVPVSASFSYQTRNDVDENKTRFPRNAATFKKLGRRSKKRKEEKKKKNCQKGNRCLPNFTCQWFAAMLEAATEITRQTLVNQRALFYYISRLMFQLTGFALQINPLAGRTCAFLQIKLVLL